MFQLLALLWSVCRLRAGPANVPYSPFHLSIVIIANVVVACYQFTWQSDMAKSLLQAILVTAISVIFTYSVLAVKGFQNRFAQTTTTLIGTNVIINALVIPLLLLQPFLLQQGLPTTMLLGFLHVIYLFTIIMMNVWLIMIMVHIYRVALEVSPVIALLVTIALLGTDILLFALLF